MRFLLKVLASFALTSLAVDAKPIVIGYERFHSQTPSIEGGRILFNELGCVNCHAVDTNLPDRKGPLLQGILQRNKADWLRSFIGNPQETKQGTSMPHLGLSKEEAENILHYLGTLEAEKEIPDAYRFANAENGSTLYHEIGCVSCHAPTSDYYPAEGKPEDDAFTYPFVPLPDLKAKYNNASLSLFLQDPLSVRPDGRMPRFSLSKELAGDLAAHLLDFQDSDGRNAVPIPKFQIDKERAIAGKALFIKSACYTCHDVPDTEGMPEYVRLEINDRFDDFESIVGHPSYRLSEQQIASIALFLNQIDLADYSVTSHLQALNCYACHDREGNGGPDEARRVYFTGNKDLGNTGRYPPPLTDIGRKLKPSWLEGVLNGNYKVRPYLRTMMPEYGASIAELADRLREVDRIESETTISSSHARVGKQLLGSEGGLNCITCHHWGDHASLGVPALNIKNMAERLEFDWLKDYLINPAAYRSNTLMPSFWPGGIASNTTILDGDTHSQIEAIYSFSLQGEGVPAGFPDIASGKFEITPFDRPIVQRTFLEGAGTKAILVGFPEGVHLAFDGETASPAKLWKGRFFDGYNTWFNRFQEFGHPLGKKVVAWPSAESHSHIQFKGYQLDSAGIPEFILSIAGAPANERFIPVQVNQGDWGIQREVRYTDELQLSEHHLTHPEGVSVVPIPSDNPLVTRFYYQW